MLIIGYFSVSLIVFVVWFIVFWNDTSTSKKDLLSWVALLLGPLVWPIVLPLSLFQISSRKSVEQEAKSEQKL
jgi:polyferredoxin